jgi:hypothetical protein
MSDTTSPLADAHVNLFADTYKPIPIGIMTLAQALEAIRTGIYAEQIAYVRRMLTRGEQSYRTAKNRLPAFTFAGTFEPSRLIANLQQHSGVVHADLDHLPDVFAAKQAISADPRTVYTFISPRGKEGLKFGVRTPILPNDPAYKHAWQTVAVEYERLYGGVWDPSGKDISRLCYVSYDPALYWNPDAACFDVPPPPTPAAKPITPASTWRESPTQHDPREFAERAIDTAVSMIQSAPLGTRHHTRLRAARLLGGFVAGGMLSEERAYGVLAQALVGYTEHLDRALKTVEDGLHYGMARPITPEDLEAERHAWIDQHRSISHHNHPKPPTANPWAGRRTLPLRPYGGLRMPREVQRG